MKARKPLPSSVSLGFNYALRTLLHVTTAFEAIKFPPLGLKSWNNEKARRRQKRARSLASLPPERLKGKHRIGHLTAKEARGLYCDWPYCTVRQERIESRSAPQDEEAEETPARRPSSKRSRSSASSFPGSSASAAYSASVVSTSIHPVLAASTVH
eukprot:6213538-Pleurochrysis_carterae.AAC.1